MVNSKEQSFSKGSEGLDIGVNSSFLKISIGRILLRMAYVREEMIIYQIWPKRTKNEKAESIVSVPKFSIERISLQEDSTRERTIFYLSKFFEYFAIYEVRTM